MIIEITLIIFFWILTNILIPLGAIYLFIWLGIKLIFRDSDESVEGKSA